MSQIRSQGSKSPFRKDEQSQSSSEVYLTDQFNSDDRKKQQQQSITISAMTQKLLTYSEKNGFDKYLKVNLVKLAEKLIQKKQFPKFIVENSTGVLKLLNKTASKFVETKDYNSGMLILDLALRISTSVKMGIDSDIQQFVTLNNIAILCSRIGKVTLSKKYLKIVLKKIEKSYKENKTYLLEIVEAITLNNLCSIYVREDKYEKVYKHSESALILIENKLFKRIKEEGESLLKKDTQFVSDLHILLQGYIYRGWSQDEIKNHAFQDYILNNQQGEDSFSDKQKIYNNGYRLSNIILGKENMMTKNFQQLLQQAKSKQQEIIQQTEKKKDTQQFDDQSNQLAFYQDRIQKVAIIYEQDYIQLSIEDKLYVLKQIFAKADNQQLSESNNITIVDSQDDIEDSQELMGLNFIKSEYVKPTYSNSQRQSPTITKKFRTLKNEQKNQSGKKLIFRNQSPNFKVNQHYSKGRRANNQYFYHNDFHHGIKERAQSYHTGLNQQYFLNQTANNVMRGMNENTYMGVDPHQQGLSQINLSQLQQQQYINNGYPNETAIDPVLPNHGLIDFQPQSLNRHQQLQQQLYLQGNGNGLFYQNKNRFNNPINYAQNTNYLNNTTDFQNNQQIINQQNDFPLNQMTNFNQQISLFNQQTPLGTSIHTNQYGPLNRTNNINGLNAQNQAQQQYLPSMQSQGMTPNQVLQAQLSNLNNIKYSFQSGLGMNNTNNGGQFQLQQNVQNLKNLTQNNAQQGFQDENNKISSNQQTFFNQIKDNYQVNQPSQQIKANDEVTTPFNNKFNNIISMENDKFSPQNQINLVTQPSNKSVKDKNQIIQNQPKPSHQEANNEANQQNDYFILNKEYNVPQSAAFPNSLADNKNLNDSRETSKQYKPKLTQENTAKFTTFNSEQLKKINEGMQQSNQNINFKQQGDTNTQGQYKIPLYLIDNKNNISQNGEITKNNKSTQPSSQNSAQTNSQSNNKALFDMNKFDDNSNQNKLINEQKREKYQEQQRTKDIVSLKNIPNIGHSQLESQTIEKPSATGTSNQNKRAITSQANNIVSKQKEGEELKDEVLQRHHQMIHNVGNLKLSESTAYNPSSPKNSNTNCQRENTNQANNNIQVNQNNGVQTAKNMSSTNVQSPTNFINNVIMMQNQQFQSPQATKLNSNLKKIKDEEIIASKMGSPYSSPQNYAIGNKFQISANQNGQQIVSMGSGTLNSVGNNVSANGQQFTYPQNNQTNSKLPTTSYTNMSQQARIQSKSRVPSINAMIQNNTNSQNTQMFASDISITKNYKQSDYDIQNPIGSQKQNQWGTFNDNDVDYLRHIKIESLINENCTVSKVLQFNSVQFLVEVGVNKNTQEIIISGFQIHDKIQLITESFSLQILRGVLVMLDLNEGTPFNKPFKTIQGFKDLCQYLIFPFIRINPQQRKIEMNYSNYSILQYQQWQVEFLKTTCLASIIHLNNNEFKFTLKQASQSQNNVDKDFIRIDIQFDDATIKSQFQKLEYQDEKGNEIVENYERDDVKLLTDISDLIDDEESKKDQVQQQIKDTLLANQKKLQKIQLANYQIPNTIIFCQKFNDLMNLVQTFLIKTHQITSYNQYIEDQSTKVLRIHINEDFKKGQIYFIRESNPQLKSVSISIQNIHETHAPHNKMVQCVGKKEVYLEEFWKTFGVQYEILDKEEKYFFLTLMGFKYNLYSHAKPLEQDDYGRYQENPIIVNTISVGGYSRILKGNAYKTPLTCQLFGINDIPYGVKVVLHDLEQNSESGVFYIIDPANWIKFKRQEDPNQKKKRTKKYKDEYDIIKNYELTNILYAIGFKLIENSVCFRKNQSNSIQVAGRILYSEFISNVDRIENVVNLSEIINYFAQQQ